MESFVLSCESTVDLPFSYVSSRNIPVLFYSYMVDGIPYEDDMGRNPGALRQFYQFIKEGKLPETSQLNEYAYLQFFEENLKKGDILHIAFGTGMTQSVGNALLAVEELRKKYPDRRIIIIDSLCSSSGYGLLVDYAADLRDAGRSMDEVAEWVLTHRQKVHHQFFSHQLDFYRRSGRMSGPAAMLASVLNICPIMRLDDAGKIIAYDRVRGKKNAIRITVDTMEKYAENGRAYSGKCFICHSDCREEALKTLDAVRERFPNISEEIRVCDIGTIIASHCGPGTVAVFFLGDTRQSM